MLQCLICSFHPLDVKEVADIVAIDKAEPYYDPENGYSSPRELLSVCSGLVSTRTAERLVGGIWGNLHFKIEELRLAHFSVKEYLVSDRVILGLASKFKLDEVSCHGTLADLCISYLLHFEQHVYDRQSVTKTSDEVQKRWIRKAYLKRHALRPEDLHLCEENPFAPYAAMCWSRHLRAANLDDMTPLYPKSMKPIADPALLDRIVNYHRIWFGAKESGVIDQLGIYTNPRRDPIELTLKSSIPPVYYASLLGLDYHVRQLLEGGESADAIGPRGTALAVAAWHGHESTVQLLLKMGANVNAQGRYRSGQLTMTALHCAIKRRHEKVAHVLLDHGAAVNTEGVTGEHLASEVHDTPLRVAVSWGNISVARKLLDRGADVTAEAFGQALGIGCDVMRSIHLAGLLLERGADPNAPVSTAGSALTYAILWRNEPLQQLLVDYGADVALVNFDSIRSLLLLKSEYIPGPDVDDYISQTKARLAQVERRPKGSIATSDSAK